MNDGGQAKIEKVEEIFVDSVWRGWRESMNQNKSIFKENMGKRHLEDKVVQWLANRKKAKRSNNFRNRVTQLGGVQIGVGDEGGCTGVTERYGMQVKVPEQMLEKLLQNDGGVNGDKGLMAKDRDKRVSTKNRFAGIGVISEVGGTGVSSSGCSARRWVNAMFEAERFASLSRSG